MCVLWRASPTKKSAVYRAASFLTVRFFLVFFGFFLRFIYLYYTLFLRPGCVLRTYCALKNVLVCCCSVNNS